ncbi:MAG: YjfB family protein [Oscillospiraceae bacterium]|nr:YjfB family protein [Oscillospiraceae bacterium]
MESTIAAMSMQMAMSNMQSAVSVSMMKKTMEAAQTSMENITEMMDAMPSPDGRGNLLNIRV